MVAAQVWTPPILMPSFMEGCRVDVFDSGSLKNTIIVEAGAFAASGGYAIYSFTDYIFVDPAVVGPDGRDQAAQFKDGDAVFLWLIGKDSDNSVHGLLSRAYDSGPPPPQAPAGHTLLRKHPGCWIWRDVWNGFPDFQYCGAQNPRITFNMFDTVPQFQVSFPGNSESPAGIDLSALVPAMGAARHVHLTWALYSPYPASCYLGWGPGVMRELGTFGQASAGSNRGETHMVCTSGGTLAYRVSDQRATLVLWVRGYDVTEVTT